MKTSIRLYLLPLLLLAGSIPARVDVPYLTGRVTDYAQIMSQPARESLTEKLKAHEDQTGNQIAVLTISTIGDESIEEYANVVFQEWGLGRKDRDNGILILVVPDDRRMRIEVGYGLEATLTDGMAGEIIRTVMTPRFRNGDYDAGITEGAMAVIRVLEGGEMPETAVASSGGSQGFHMEGPDLSLKERILFGAFIFGIIGLFTFIGIATPGIGWFLYFFLIPFWAMFPIVVFGGEGAFRCLVAYVVGFPIIKLTVRNTKWYKKAKKSARRKGRKSTGVFGMSSRSSGRSWSSGSSGSFSGGGGSSGGGGASGSW